MRVKRTLQEIDFEWDGDKAASNLEKHDVAFDEACEVFFDPFVQALPPREVDNEDREAVIGLTKRWRMLYVAYAWRDMIIRIISARKVTKTERRIYENQ